MKLLPVSGRVVCLLTCVVMATGCATFYRRSSDLMAALYEGRLDAAEKILDKPFWEKSKKNILLYYLNKGAVLWMNGKPVESNEFFRKADFYIEDYRTNYAAGAVSLLTNPNFVPYSGEGFEQILLHYYTTLNYMDLGHLDDALVECKRMQQKLNLITDYYNGRNKYKRDAFAHNLMGMIYDAQHDYNNAFIAYRNALEIYREDYGAMLKTPVPAQLKKDLIRTAYLTGFRDEGSAYEHEFNLTYEAEDRNNGSLVFFWNNGLGPVKDQWSINFSIVPQADGSLRLVNWDLNLSFPYAGSSDKEKNKSLANLKFIRVAFPKYVSRKPLYTSARLKADSFGIDSKLNIAEDVNAIAYRSLEDRMLKELGEALVRLALKQAAEEQLRKEKQEYGAALSILNAITEQADTRNWQMLPYAIEYTRISLPQGQRSISLIAQQGNGSEMVYPFTYNISAGTTVFGTFQTMQFEGYASDGNPRLQ
jgi:hypothetical protein